MAPLTLGRLRDVLNYDAATGLFTWRETLSASAPAGMVAGKINRHTRGRVIGIDGSSYSAHRLAWLYHHGTWPAGEVDHIDCNRDNNAITNLREATRAQNAANMPLRADNKSGFKGVSFCNRAKKWRVVICVHGKQIHLGLFLTAEAGHAAYVAAARKYFGQFARAA